VVSSGATRSFPDRARSRGALRDLECQSEDLQHADESVEPDPSASGFDVVKRLRTYARGQRKVLLPQGLFTASASDGVRHFAAGTVGVQSNRHYFAYYACCAIFLLNLHFVAYLSSSDRGADESAFRCRFGVASRLSTHAIQK
jgi:hypothetical protein